MRDDGKAAHSKYPRAADQPGYCKVKYPTGVWRAIFMPYMMRQQYSKVVSRGKCILGT